MKVKSMARISKKFQDRTSVAGPEYEAGVENPRKPWAAATQAAESNYEQGTQKAITQKRFGKGVARAGDA